MHAPHMLCFTESWQMPSLTCPHWTLTYVSTAELIRPFPNTKQLWPLCSSHGYPMVNFFLFHSSFLHCHCFSLQASMCVSFSSHATTSSPAASSNLSLSLLFQLTTLGIDTLDHFLHCMMSVCPNAHELYNKTDIQSYIHCDPRHLPRLASPFSHILIHTFMLTRQRKRESIMIKILVIQRWVFQTGMSNLQALIRYHLGPEKGTQIIKLGSNTFIPWTTL